MVSVRPEGVISQSALARVARPSISSSWSLLPLPHELVDKIAALVVSVPGVYHGTAFISAKPRWPTVAGLANASRETRAVALRAWFRVLVLRKEEDWEMATRFGPVGVFVHELYVLAAAVRPTTSPDALLAFPALRAVHINAHNDVLYDVDAGYKYYTLLPSVPKRLKRLAITHAHAPDGERLEALARANSGIEELRLGRCTLFDFAMEGCSYWPAFPHDHDTYFSNTETVEYATGIAQDLAPLRNLHTVHLGVYLTPNAAIAEHQQHHSPAPAPSSSATIPNLGSLLHPPPPHHLHITQHPYYRAPLHSPSLWSSRCEACLVLYGPATQTAEHDASMVLGSLVPGLQEISWAGYFELCGHGVSVWRRVACSDKDDWVPVPSQAN